MKTEILIIKAYEGDCILIKTFDADNNPFNILIDGGPSNTFDFSLRKELTDIKTIHLLILTHIDSDHIGGLIRFISNSLFNEIEVMKYWINCKNLIDVGSHSDKISYGQAKSLEELLIEKKEPLEKFQDTITVDSVLDVAAGIKIKVLSPTLNIVTQLNNDWEELSKLHKEQLKNRSISAIAPSQVSKGALKELSALEFKHQKTLENDVINSSSIALIIEGLDFSFLSLADSRAEIIESQLKKLSYNNTDNKLKVDYVKVSHHGSKNNTSNNLLDLIDSNNFIISTNGGKASKHPDRETIARIIFHPNRNFDETVNVIFNYPLDVIQTKCGKLFTDEELTYGNWRVSDNVNKLS